MNNTKKIYQHAGKCDDQQNLKDIIYAAILSTPEGVDIIAASIISLIFCSSLHLPAC